MFVNTGPVELSKQEEFSLLVPLSAGINTIVVTARDPSGRENTIVRTVPRADVLTVE